MCTIAETPRLPEHCIQYAYVVMWEQEFGKDKVVDKDSPDDMQWIFKKAEARAYKFGINGVTYSLTMGVVKNIIPAIASTNAIISAACVTEVIKILSGCNHVMDNYMQYMGQTGVSTHTFVSERTSDCLVCKLTTVPVTASKSDTLAQVIEWIKASLPETQRTSFNSLHNGEILYIPHPPVLEEKHHYKLELTLAQLVDQGILLAGDQKWIVIDK